LGSGKDDILCEDSDSITGWFGLSFTWQLSSNNPELSNL
jgi:hypothetical protein